MTADDIIALLKLEPHPKEGGFFREIYRSSDSIAPDNLADRYDNEARSQATAIYYLLTPDTYSHIHTVASDETFHFYMGDPVEMLQLHPGGHGEKTILGSGIMAGEKVTTTVPHGVWQGCKLRAGGAFALMGCTVTPGFEYQDYEHGTRSYLIKHYPNFTDEIIALTDE